MSLPMPQPIHTINDLKKALLPPKHRYATQDEAHDAMMAEIKWWLDTTRGTPAFPSERTYLRKVSQLWLEVYRHFAPRG